jgi:hypothetical protein
MAATPAFPSIAAAVAPASPAPMIAMSVCFIAGIPANAVTSKLPFGLRRSRFAAASN